MPWGWSKILMKEWHVANQMPHPVARSHLPGHVWISAAEAGEVAHAV
jgi:hypothetical protein